MSKAQQGFATVQQFLSDPKHSKHLTVEDRQDITANLDRLRERLDGLKHFKEVK